MKTLLQLPIKIVLIVSWFAIATIPVRSQSGNMSDITMPNPGEITPDTPGNGETTTEGVSSGEQNSDTPGDTVAGDDTDTPGDTVAGDDTDTSGDNVAGDDTDTPGDTVAGDDTDTSGDNVAGDDTDTSGDTVAGDDTDTPEDTVAGDDGETPGDTVAGDDTDTSEDTVAGDDTDTPEDNVAGDDGETPGDTVAGDDGETSGETPMEESMVVEEDIATDENIPDENLETPDEEITTGDRDRESPNNNIADDNDAAERNAVNENIMEAIANDNEVPDPELTSNDNDGDVGLRLGENTAGDSNIVTGDNIVNNLGESTPESEINTNTQTESAVETKNTSNLDNEIESQPIVEDSVEQNIETADGVDSQSTTTTSDNPVETETVVTEETNNTETISSEVDIEREINASNEVVDNQEVNQETTTENDSIEREINASDEVVDNQEVNQETTTGDDSTKTETTANDEVVDNREVNEETTIGDDSTKTETTANDATTEEIEEDTAASREETGEEAESTQDNEEEIKDTEDTEEAEDTEDTEDAEDTEDTEDAENTEEGEQDSNEKSQDLGQEVDRIAYEVQVQEAPTDIAIQMQEEFQLTQLIDTSGMQLYGQIPSVKDISNRLAELGEQTGKNPAFVNISLQSDRLEAFVVLPNDTKTANSDNSLVASTDLNKLNSPKTSTAITLRETVKDTSRKELIATATKFREEVSDSSKLNQTSYLKSSQELYRVLIKPIEAELEANNIDILVFSMDSGLRLLPLAALHDGEQFLIEKYAVAMVPSFGLTDTRYVSLDKSSILAMGASEFIEQAALPTMPIELETIVSKPRQGEVFINEQFTIDNFKAQNKRETPFPIVHLGTHAEFKAGNLNDSYIQFYDDKLKISQLQDLSEELGWNSDATPIELLVLSACETALGDEQAELGFAGLAVQAGVKSALASLWYVSDVGTLALMGEFYDRLGDTLIKAEALRETQLKMLQGNVKVSNKQVSLSNGESLNLPPEFPEGTLTLDHPYFWSAFTLIGNWN